MGNICGGASSGGVDAPAGGVGAGKYSHGPLLAARAKAAKDLDSCKKDEFAKKYDMKKLLGRGEYSKVSCRPGCARDVRSPEPRQPYARH